MADISPVPVPVRDEIPSPKTETKAVRSDKSKVASVSAANPRKLVRPMLPAKDPAVHNTDAHNPGFRGPERRSMERRSFERRSTDRYKFSRETPSLSAQPRSPAGPASFSEKTSHAETFYLQKQAHSQTLMVFVLDDGEQIGGYIEWYDRDVIKVRHGGRTLIYKSSIKYLYKAEENISV